MIDVRLQLGWVMRIEPGRMNGMVPIRVIRWHSSIPLGEFRVVNVRITIASMRVVHKRTSLLEISIGGSCSITIPVVNVSSLLVWAVTWSLRYFQVRMILQTNRGMKAGHTGGE